MALQKDMANINNTGINLTNAYIMIPAIQLDKLNKRALILVFVYPSQIVRASPDRVPVTQLQYTVQTNLYDLYFSPMTLDKLNSNPYQQAYEYLKTLPEFSGALNV